MPPSLSVLAGVIQGNKCVNGVIDFFPNNNITIIITISGRWIDVEAFGSMCKEWMCVGSNEEMKFIFDLFSFNEKYVWVPWDCVYKFYSGEHDTNHNYINASNK